jgi:hypothetical protein
MAIGNDCNRAVTISDLFFRVTLNAALEPQASSVQFQKARNRKLKIGLAQSWIAQ